MPARPSGHRASVAGLACDVGLPLIGYYTPHGFGASDCAALLTATAAAGARLIWVAARTRQITWFASVMLAVFGAGTALTFTGGDARVLLLKDSVTTAMIGAVFLVSLLSERPLTLRPRRPGGPGRRSASPSCTRVNRPPGARSGSAPWAGGPDSLAKPCCACHWSSSCLST
jgi:hypothetical protein